MNFKQRSFTLIELLVVISIIGVLGSIILASLGGAKDRADIAKSQQFSHTIRTSLGADLVGEWRLNDVTATDSSGNGNDGTVHGPPVQVDGMFDDALVFNGNDYIVIDSVADATALNNALTWESWIKTTDFSDNVLGGWNTSANGNLFWFRVHNELGDRFLQIYDGVSHNSQKDVSDGIWHHIAVIYDNGNTTAYIDGEIDIGPYSRSRTFSSSDKVTIGAEWDSGVLSGYFNGIIDEVRIYNKALSSAEIQQLYAQGAASHETVLITN